MRKALFSCVIALAMNGCALGDFGRSETVELAGPPTRVGFGSDVTSELALSDLKGGVMNGRFNSTDLVDAPIYEIRAFKEVPMTLLELHAGGSSWFMLGLDTTVDLTTVEPGVRVEHGPIGIGNWSGRGCAGPDQDNVEIDVPADSFTLEVFEGANPNERIVEIAVYFPYFYEYQPITGEYLNATFSYTLP
jgi:hypothetical protein